MICSSVRPAAMPCADPAAQIDQHVAIADEVGAAGERAVAGDDHRLLVGDAEAGLDGGDGAVDRAARIEVDEGQHAVEKGVAHVEHVGARPVDQHVAVGMGVVDMDDADVVAVEVEGEVLAEGDHRQRARRATAAPRSPRTTCSIDMRARTLSWATMTVPARPRFSFPPLWSPCQWVLITKRIGSGSSAAHRRDDALGRRRILIVDQDIAVGAVGEADIAAAAEQDGDAGRDPLDADLGRRRRLVGERGRGGEQKRER